MLIEQEKEIEQILEMLHKNGIETSTIQSYRELAGKLEHVLNLWEKFLSNNEAFDMLEPLIKNLKSGENTKLLETTSRNLDLLITPFEHYMLALEEFKHPSFRDSTTRCGIVIERMLKRLWPIITNGTIPETKVENQIGILQKHATETLQLQDAEDICNLMKGIYHTRDRKGPHDVPAAEEMDAKYCISSIPRVYHFYLQIAENKYPEIRPYGTSLRQLANSILTIKPAIVTGKKGEKPIAEDAILMLYKNGFFKDRVTFSEIVGKLEQLELSFPRSTIMNTLKRLHKEGVLTREGSKRNYMFMQRIRPEDYFK